MEKLKEKAINRTRELLEKVKELIGIIQNESDSVSSSNFAHELMKEEIRLMEVARLLDMDELVRKYLMLYEESFIWKLTKEEKEKMKELEKTLESLLGEENEIRSH